MPNTDTKFTPVSDNLVVSIDTLIKFIPDFDTAQPTQVYRFVRSCDSVFRIASVQQQGILLTFTLNKILGPGASDLHAKDFPSWADLKTHLIQKFSQTKTLAHLSLELQSMFQKPSESITDYYLRVDLHRSKILEKLSTEVQDITLEGRRANTEETALNVFVNGLSSDIGTMLRVHSFKHLRDAGNFAIQEEKIRNMNAARQQLHKNASQPRNPIPKNSNHQSNQQSIIPNTTPKKFCRYCKNPGHDIAECRKRAYNNRMKTGSNNQNQRPVYSKANVPNPASVHNLNSQAAGEMSNSPETALDLCSETQIQDPQFNLDHLQLQ